MGKGPGVLNTVLQKKHQLFKALANMWKFLCSRFDCHKSCVYYCLCSAQTVPNILLHCHNPTEYTNKFWQNS